MSLTTPCPYCGQRVPSAEYFEHLAICPNSPKSDVDLSKLSIFKVKPKKESPIIVETPTEKELLQEMFYANKKEPTPLRPYQIAALNAWQAHNYHGILFMPTATGKTRVAIEAQRTLKLPMLAIVPKISIIKTWKEEFAKAGIFDVGSYYGREHMIKNVTVGLYQSAIKYPDLLHRFQFIVFDEAHHLGSHRNSSLLSYVQHAPYVMGLTAHIEEREPEFQKVFRVLPVIYKMNFQDARDYIAPIIIKPLQVPMTDMEATEYITFTQKIRRALQLTGARPKLWPALAAKGDIAAKMGLKAIGDRNLLLSRVSSKKEAVRQVVEQHPNEMVLLFSESIPALEQIKHYLAANGLNAWTYHSQMTDSRRRQTLDYWGKYFKILLTARALEEGYNVPQVSIGIFQASGRTPRRIIQRVGRIIRKARRPDGTEKVAQLYVIYVHGTIEDQVKQNIITAVTTGF